MFSKKDKFRDFLIAYLEEEVFPEWGLYFKEKNLIRWELTLLFMRSLQFIWKATLKMRELLPLNVNPFTLSKDIYY